MSIQAIVLLGAPGAGKGTIAEAIQSASAFIHVSTGDMLREAIKAGTPVGREAEVLMRQGALVPDEIILKIVMARLEQGGPDALYMFDGFPRTLGQARLMDAEFTRRGAKLSHVFLLDVSHEVSLERLTGRRICCRCGANFHVRNIPPKTAGVCDACGGKLAQRPDDSRATILTRLEVFQQQTAGLIAYYEKRGLLQRVDSSGSRDETVAEIMKRLQ